MSLITLSTDKHRGLIIDTNTFNNVFFTNNTTLADISDRSVNYMFQSGKNSLEQTSFQTLKYQSVYQRVSYFKFCRGLK